MVSFEPSLHSGWGTGVVMGDLGFILNCRGDYYSLVPGEANALEPGKRPRHAPEHPRDEGRSALHDPRQPGRRRPDHADDADAHQRDRLRHERPAGDRGAALVHAQLPGVAISTHDAGDLSVEDRIPVAVQKALISKGTQADGVGAVVARRERGDCRGRRARRAERRRRRPERRLRLGAINARAVDPAPRAPHGVTHASLQRRLAILAGVLLVVVACVHVSSAQARQANIVMIVGDDMGYADIGVHGSKDIPTPHIDALARGGVRFTDAYVTGRTAARPEPDC